MQPKNLTPELAEYLHTLNRPTQHSPEVQAVLEHNRRALLCGPLLSKTEEISGHVVEAPTGPHI